MEGHECSGEMELLKACQNKDQSSQEQYLVSRNEMVGRSMLGPVFGQTTV